MDLRREASRDLVSAVRKGELWALGDLLQEGADPNWVYFGSPTTTALHLAAKRRDAEMLEVLIAAGGDLGNVVLGSTPLEVAIGAVSDGHVQTDGDAFCAWMLSLDQQLRSMDEQAVAKAIVLSLNRRCIQTFAELISPPYLDAVGNSEALGSCFPAWENAGAEWLKDIATEDGVDVRDAAVHWVVCDEYVDGLRHLLKSGFNVDAALRGATPLHQALSRRVGQDIALEMVQVLLDAGASPVGLPENQFDALKNALRNGHHKVARLLVDGGHVALLGSDDLNGCLGAAVKRGDADVASLLLEWGADHTIRVDGKTLLELAPSKSEDVRRLLRSYRLGTSLEAALGDVSGESALRHSVGADPL